MKIRENRHLALRLLRKWEDPLYWHYHEPILNSQSSGSELKLSKKSLRNLAKLLKYRPQPTRAARIFKNRQRCFISWELTP